MPFLKGGRHLWTHFSQFFSDKNEEFLCPSERKFPELFKTHPTFVYSPHLVPSMACQTQRGVFFETPCMFYEYLLKRNFSSFVYSLDSWKTRRKNGEIEDKKKMKTKQKKKSMFFCVIILCETQSGLPAAFPFGGYSLHECNITERNRTHTIIYIDSILEYSLIARDYNKML